MHRLLIAAAVLFPSVAFAADWRDAALADVRSEKSVVEAKFANAGTLWVSMVDDGSRRDGFASYLCLSLSDRDRAIRVRILDAKQLSQGAFVTLGETWCERS